MLETKKRIEMAEKKLISEFKGQLSSGLDKTKGFKIILEDDWEQQTGWIQLYDIVLYRQGIPFAVFEFKEDKNQINLEAKSILSALKITKARYGIFVVRNEYYLLDKGNRFEKLEKINFETLINYLNNPTSIFLSVDIKKEIEKVIYNRVNEFIVNNQKHYFLSFLENSNLFEKKLS